MKSEKFYKKSYRELIEKILLDLEILQLDIQKGMSGVFIATKRARVKSVEVGKLLKEYRERSVAETKRLITRKRIEE